MQQLSEILRKLNAIERELGMLRTERSGRRLMKLNEAATYLGVGATTLRRMVAANVIEWVKLDGDIRFEVETLNKYIAAHTVKAKTIELRNYAKAI